MISKLCNNDTFAAGSASSEAHERLKDLRARWTTLFEVAVGSDSMQATAVQPLRAKEAKDVLEAIAELGDTLLDVRCPSCSFDPRRGALTLPDAVRELRRSIAGHAKELGRRHAAPFATIRLHAAMVAVRRRAHDSPTTRLIAAAAASTVASLLVCVLGCVAWGSIHPGATISPMNALLFAWPSAILASWLCVARQPDPSREVDDAEPDATVDGR